MNDPIILSLYNNTVNDKLLWGFVGRETYFESANKIMVTPSKIIYNSGYVYQGNTSEITNLHTAIEENIDRQDVSATEKRRALLNALDN